jgi:hypothetical protein
MIGPVRIVIGEDQALLCHSLVRLLEDAGFEVAGQAADATALGLAAGAVSARFALRASPAEATHARE